MIAQATSPDVIVVGGGPAGATASTLIAQQGYEVVLFERERFPRYHIGESLIPETYWVLERLKMLDKLRESQFVKKHSVQFINGMGKLSEPFYFRDNKPHESSQTWQVLRSEFDQMMLNNAAEQGVSVHEGVRVLEVLFDGSKAVGVRIQDEDGHQSEIFAKVVVDAAGQSNLLMDRLGLRIWDPELKKAACWTYWKGAYRDSGRDEGATLVMQLEDRKGWFWYIPLHDDIVSVGVVASFDYLFANRDTKDIEKIYFEEVSRCPGVQPRIANAERVAPIRAAKEYSYQASQVAGDGGLAVANDHRATGRQRAHSAKHRLVAGDLPEHQVLADRVFATLWRDEATRKERLHLRAVDEGIARVGVVERLDAHAVARQEQRSTVAVPEREGEHTVHTLDAALAHLGIQLEDDLGVAVRLE